MMAASRSAAAEVPLQSSQREEELPLLAAVRELLSELRAGAADVADLVAAEAHVALRSLMVLVIAAIGGAVLAVLGLAALVAALATELVALGLSLSLAISVVALLCMAGSVLLMFQLRKLSRRVLFGTSRRQLRGQH